MRSTMEGFIDFKTLYLIKNKIEAIVSLLPSPAVKTAEVYIKLIVIYWKRTRQLTANRSLLRIKKQPRYQGRSSYCSRGR